MQFWIYCINITIKALTLYSSIAHIYFSGTTHPTCDCDSVTHATMHPRSAMYNDLFSIEKQKLFPPPLISRASSFSTVATPPNEDELAAARNVLRSVISSTRSSPRTGAVVPNVNTLASVPPLPPLTGRTASSSVGVQTDSVTAQVPLEGLVRAAGMALANFASEVKALERRIDSQHSEVLLAIAQSRGH